MSHLVTMIEAERPDALLLTGDIHEAKDDGVLKALEHIARQFGKPVYFVLGNHDFFGSSIGLIRRAAAELEHRIGSKTYFKHLRYLTAQLEPIELSPDTGLIGHDGWADGRIGVIDKEVELNDHKLILDFAPLTQPQRLSKMTELGEQAAVHIWLLLRKALAKYKRVIMALHTPPFREACVREGKPCDNESWLPHLVCKAVGDIVMRTMERHPDKRLEIYCGHTHERTIHEPLHNLKVTVGTAAYGCLPPVQVIEV